MIDIDKLNDNFGIKGKVGFSKPENNLTFLTISNKYAEADICLYGAHVTRFKPHNSKDILWMSPESSFEIGKPIRGGIPVCFPWFGPHKTDPKKPQHGFGRLMYWDLVETANKPGGETLIRLQLCSSDATKAYWPYNFCAAMTIIVGQTLEVSLKVINSDDKPFEYTCALHSYYNVSDIGNITITGLSGASYHSQLEPGEFIQVTPKIEISKAETRHYHNTGATCMIEDTIFERKISVAKSGSKITTVWNPGKETCATIGDMPNDAYKTFVCVEAVNAFDDVVRLAPKESHTTSALIGVEE
jgi:glucose-6-phosphate 1-epimerase